MSTMLNSILLEEPTVLARVPVLNNPKAKACQVTMWKTIYTSQSIAVKCCGSSESYQKIPDVKLRDRSELCPTQFRFVCQARHGMLSSSVMCFLSLVQYLQRAYILVFPKPFHYTFSLFHKPPDTLGVGEPSTQLLSMPPL